VSNKYLDAKLLK